MKKIIVVEDELFMRKELVSILENEGYETFYISNFNNVSSQIIDQKPDLILLDLNLPKVSGFEICKEVRLKSKIPILVLTGREQLKDELHALNLGADEYLNKPCHKDRLIARIANLLRRVNNRDCFVEFKEISLDIQTYTMYVDSISTVLPENQGKIMELLLRNSGEIVTKDMLFEKLWGTSEYVDENILQVNMTRLKKKIKELGINYRVITKRGEGYYIQAVGDNIDD